MTENERVIEELEWFKSELLKGDKVIEYYQAQVDILTKAIKLLKQNDRDNNCTGNRMFSDCSPNRWGSDSDYHRPYGVIQRPI